MGRKSKNLLKQSVFPLAANAKASILILSLWSICLLTSFAVILGFVVRQKLTLVNWLDERDQLRFIADAGLKRVISQIKEEPDTNYTALKDGLNNDIIFRELAIGDGKISISYDYINERTGSSEPRYGLIDEESKININKIDMAIIERLFRLIGFEQTQAQELAAAIIDWRDSDSELSIPLGSAEDSYYRNAEYPYESKDANFEVLEEVLLVKGIDKDIFEKVKNYITIYGSGKINLNTASRIVLLALGLSDNIVEKLLTFRSGNDGIIGTSDDNVFDSSSGIVPTLSAFYQFSDSEIAQLSAIVDQYLITNSQNFMARSISWLNGKARTAEVIFVVNRSGRVLYWQES